MDLLTHSNAHIVVTNFLIWLTGCYVVNSMATSAHTHTHTHTLQTSYEYAYAETESRKPSLPTSRKVSVQQHSSGGGGS